MFQILFLASLIFHGVSTLKVAEERHFVSAGINKRFPMLLKFFCNTPIGMKRMELEKFKEDKAIIPVIERVNLTSTQADCNKDTPEFMCPSRTVLRQFPHHFPSHMIEQECTCDKCSKLGVGKAMIAHTCMPLFETERILHFESATCEWKRATRKKVIGCQCVMNRKIQFF